MIWVIDDDAYMLKLLGYKIQKFGHETMLFNSTEEALSNQVASEITHVFTDIHLEGKSGFELAEILKEKEQFSRTTFIALTSDDLSEDEKAQSLFHHIFQKPLGDDELNSLLTEKFDFPYLNAMIESEEDKIEIIRHFHEETTRDRQDLLDALENSDRETMLLLSHRLCGRLAQFSQEEISTGFRAVETQLIEGNSDVTESLTTVLSQLSGFLKKLERI